MAHSLTPQAAESTTPPANEVVHAGFPEATDQLLNVTDLLPPPGDIDTPHRHRLALLVAGTTVITSILAACGQNNPTTEAAPAPTRSVSSSPFSAPTPSSEAPPSSPAPLSPSHVPTIHTSSPPPRTRVISPASSPAETATPNLLPYQEKPGYGKEVSPAAAERLKVATVEILMRAKGSNLDSAWLLNCNGTLVTINGTLTVATAAHCLIDYTADQLDRFTHPQDVTNALQTEYGIRLANGTIIKLASTVVTGGKVDMALFSISPTDPHRTALKNTPSITAPSYGDFLTNPAPEIGSVGIGFATTDTGHNKTAWIYLGRIEDPAKAGSHIDLWGVKDSSATATSCDSKGSGSAIAAVTGISGPVRLRSDIKTTGNEYNGSQTITPKDQRDWRNAADSRLGFSTRGFRLVCGTQALNTATLQNTIAAFKISPAKI